MSGYYRRAPLPGWVPRGVRKWICPSAFLLCHVMYVHGHVHEYVMVVYGLKVVPKGDLARFGSNRCTEKLACLRGIVRTSEWTRGAYE
jgi:hypothetical protein